MGRPIVGLVGCSLVGMLCAAAISAAEPKPVLDFDFSKAVNGVVKDRAASGLALKLGPEAAIEDGALTLDPADGSFAAADEKAFQAWARKLDTREIAASFWIGFDKSSLGGARNADTANLGLFNCDVDQDGYLAVGIISKKTELFKPVVMTSKTKVEFGKWYHVEFSYSMNARRYALYIDGDFQVESASELLPVPAVGELRLGNGFRGAVKDLKFYDAALGSEELALSRATAEDYDNLKKTANAVAASTKNPYLKSWAAELAKRAATYKATFGKVTIAAGKRLAKSVANAQKLARGIEDAKDTVSDKVVTAYVTPATTQALYLPYDLPENGKLSNKIELAMAQDEFETASVIVVPFRPVKNFTLKMGDLQSSKNVLKGSDTNIKLVKRWYRTGGAWLSYHVDLYMRVLTPDMLLNDDKLIQVDEFRRTNKVLFHYPGGDRYVDVSEFRYRNEFLRRGLEEYFYDAPTLQPLELSEAGRNQQYLVTFRAPKGTAPGFYDGKLQLLADGKDAGSIDVTIRVLPFVLPQPKTYYDSSRTYLSHINRYNGVPATLKNAMDHNLMHLTGVTDSPERIKTCVEIGYPLEIIFGGPKFRGNGFEFGGLDSERTPESEAQLERMTLAPFLRYQKMIEEHSPARDYTCYRIQSSEAGWYGAISRGPDRLSRVLNEKTKFKLFSHGMSNALPFFSPGIYDMNSDTKIKREHADIWHAAGGRCITYSFPFPGPENPGLMRRAVGLELYKANHYDGHMMHGYVGDQLNEFTKYPGGDGDYRTFCLAYRQKDGCINRLPVIGCREGYDDVRYATMLKVQAEDALENSKDELVVREAKRQLAWLERVDGDKKDLDDFRTEVQYRILVLMDLIKEREGE